MKNPFKKEVANYQTQEPTTPYQQAQQEWDARVGTATVQAKNWRIIAFFSLLISILLLASLIIALISRKDKLYIAEVTKEGRVVNVAPLLVTYRPSEAQKEYFVSHFIELIDSMTLDPVAVKRNWLHAYDFLTSSGAQRLNTYFKQNNPTAILGKKTVTVEIVDVNPVSEATIHVDWNKEVVNTDGQSEGKKNYSGVFTITTKQPTTREEMLRNPLGIYLVDFNISAK
jgi:type IV secretory pathway TrbF-like protein